MTRSVSVSRPTTWSKPPGARLFCQIEAVIFQKFLFLVVFPRLLALALVLLAARLRLLCPALIGGKQLIEKWKGCGLAVRVLIVLIF